jgi:hypothetical protein
VQSLDQPARERSANSAAVKRENPVFIHSSPPCSRAIKE